MNSFIKLPISLNTLTTVVDEIMKKHGYVPTESTEGKTIKMKEFAQKYCCGKAMPWIRLFIFDGSKVIDNVKGSDSNA